MRILLLIIALAVLASFKEPESCEYISGKESRGYMIIFPICGDSSIYIVRMFDRSSYIQETVYKDRKESTLTFLHFSTKKEQHFAHYISCDEVFYQDGKRTESRSYFQPNYIVTKKTFWIDTGLSFEINYYRNGFIKNYCLLKNGCPPSNGAELDSMNTFLWKGKYDGTNLSDTTAVIDTTSGEYKLIVTRRCGKQSGTWTKTDFSGKILETIKYPDNAENKMRNK